MPDSQRSAFFEMKMRPVLVAAQSVVRVAEPARRPRPCRRPSSPEGDVRQSTGRGPDCRAASSRRRCRWRLVVTVLVDVEVARPDVAVHPVLRLRHHRVPPVVRRAEHVLATGPDPAGPRRVVRRRPDERHALAAHRARTPRACPRSSSGPSAFIGSYEVNELTRLEGRQPKFGSAMSKLLWPPSAMFVLTHVSPAERLPRAVVLRAADHDVGIVRAVPRSRRSGASAARC